MDIEALRAVEFPWAADGEAVYLNNASTGPLPVRSLRAVEEFNALRQAPHRLTEAAQFGVLDRCRELCAHLIGASSTEIALATNTSFGINLAAHALPLGRGDVVIGADWEFPANVYPWMHVAAARGAEFRLLPVRDGIPSEDELVAWLDDPRVRIVALSWVAFASGYRFSLERIGAACRAKGVYFVVDAIQGVGALPLDVVRASVDILSCGAQKWLLSPWGAGFVYVRRDLIPELQPHDVSWMAVRGSDDFSRLVQYDLTWRDDARRFEQITLPYQDFAGAAASLGLLRDVGIETVAERVRHHADRIVEFALANDLPLVTPQDPARRAGIVSVRPPNAASVSARLKEAGVVHSLREGMIRLSPHFYNTDAEVERALEVLGETANAASQPTTISR